MSDSYNEAVGRRIRAIRRQKHMSLQDVEAVSNQEFKASVLGAYERGERSLSLPRMRRLAEFYSVPIDQLLPTDDRSIETPLGRQPAGGITIDLNKVERADGEAGELLERFLRAIQLMRQDFNGRVLTIRQADLRLLANLIERSEEALGELFVDIGASDAGE